MGVYMSYLFIWLVSLFLQDLQTILYMNKESDFCPLHVAPIKKTVNYQIVSLIVIVVFIVSFIHIVENKSKVK